MEDQSASCRPIQNRGTKLRKGGPQRAVPLWLRKEIQAMLRPQLTGEFSLDATSSPRKVLHCLDSEIRIDADPSRILFSIRINTAGHGSHAPHWRSVSPVATLMISHKRKRWRPQPEDPRRQGYDTDSFINRLVVRGIKAATRYEKTARNFPCRAASGLRTRLAQITRGP